MALDTVSPVICGIVWICELDKLTINRKFVSGYKCVIVKFEYNGVVLV